MRILLFGTYDKASHPRVAVLEQGLRRRGLQVQECNAPLGIGTAARVAALRQPWRVPTLALRVVSRWLLLVLRSARFRRRSAVPEVVLVGYLGHFDVLLARRLFPHSTIVLDHLIGASDTAQDRGETGSLKHRALRAIDRAALAAADIVVVDTDEQLATLPPDAREKAVVVAVGAPQAWFDAGHAAGETLATAGEPLCVVFFGLFTPLQGAPVVGEALALLAAEGVRVRATLIGSGQDLAATHLAAGTGGGTTWLEWVTPEELPAIVAAHDVCLGIFGTGPKALRVVPNKVFQGAAAGCAVVTSDTAPQRRSLGDAAVLVAPGSPDALARALRSLAADPALLRARRLGAHTLALRSFSAEQVVAPLVERLAGSRA